MIKSRTKWLVRFDQFHAVCYSASTKHVNSRILNIFRERTLRFV